MYQLPRESECILGLFTIDLDLSVFWQMKRRLKSGSSLGFLDGTKVIPSNYSN